MKRNCIFTAFVVAVALCMAGCGCAPAPPGPSPSWKQVQSARIPSQCGHKPTKLVNGKHTGIPKGHGYFEFAGTLNSGKRGYVTNVPSSAGRLTAVVANCSQGGVGWPHQILFFGPGATFVASTDLYNANWSRYGLYGPARNGVQSISRTKSGLSLNISAERTNDASCCPSGHATVNVKVSDGKVVITGIQRR